MSSIAISELVHRCEKHPEKIQYRNAESAFEVAERRSPLEGAPIYVYACDHCGYFHLSKKRGTEDIGRRVMAANDGKVWESATANPRNLAAVHPIRDERFVPEGPLAEFRADVARVIREHGTPDQLRTHEVRDWLGGEVSNLRVRSALTALGWIPTGIRRAMVWNRTLETVTVLEAEVPQKSKAVVPAPAPAAPARAKPAAPADLALDARLLADSAWQVLDVKGEVRHLTVGALATAYAAAGLELRIMVRPAGKI